MLKLPLTGLLFAIAATPIGSAPAVDPSGASSTFQSEINESGQEASLRVEMGDLSASLKLRACPKIDVTGFSLRHPIISLGMLERGDLIRLFDSPSGSWTRVSAAALSRVPAVEKGDPVPAKYGIVLSPVPGELHFFSFVEPDFPLGGVHGLAEGHHATGELLWVFSQTPAAPPPDEWMLEHRAPFSNAYVHGLARLSVTVGPVVLTGGCAVSAAPHAGPHAAASSTLDIRLKRFQFSATVAGGTEGYFGLHGKPLSPPLYLAYLLSTGKPTPAAVYLKHEVEIETLPLLRIPFRKTDESLHLGFEFSHGTLSVEADGRLRILTDRTGWQEILVEGGLSFGLGFSFGTVKLGGNASIASNAPFAYSFYLPVKLKAGNFTFEAEARYKGGEAPCFKAGIGLGGASESGTKWYLSAAVEIENPAQTGTGRAFSIGWRIESAATS